MTSPIKIFVPQETAAVSMGADEVAEKITLLAQENGENIELVRNGSIEVPYK